MYGLIGEAEAKAHNKSIKEIHFHEVGTMDAIADVVGVCMLIDKINPDRIMVSPVHVGSGNVRCSWNFTCAGTCYSVYFKRGSFIFR